MASRKATIKDIATEAGVSVSLVSFVMNNRSNSDGTKRVYRVSEETAQRILEVARRLDYQPNNAARSLRIGKTKTIGVIVSDISNKFFADIGRYVEDAACRRNYTVFFGSSDENPDKLDNIVGALMSRGVDGLIVVPCEKSEATVAKIVASGMPLVLIDRDIEGVETNRVLLNNRRAEYQATESLIRKGCSRIDMISYAMRLSNIRDREAGYRQAMCDHGLGGQVNIHNIRFKNIPGQIAKAVDDLLARDVDGVVFATNTLTVEGIKCLRSTAPEALDRIRLVAFDESEAFELSDYRISYVKQPIEMFGAESVRILLDCIDYGNQQLVTAILNPQFIEME